MNPSTIDPAKALDFVLSHSPTLAARCPTVAPPQIAVADRYLTANLFPPWSGVKHSVIGGFYDPGYRPEAVFITDHMAELQNPISDSIIVHEVTHYVQHHANLLNTRYTTREESEGQAYQIQLRYLLDVAPVKELATPDCLRLIQAYMNDGNLLSQTGGDRECIRLSRMLFHHLFQPSTMEKTT